MIKNELSGIPTLAQLHDFWLQKTVFLPVPQVSTVPADFSFRFAIEPLEWVLQCVRLSPEFSAAGLPSKSPGENVAPEGNVVRSFMVVSLFVTGEVSISRTLLYSSVC